MASLLKIKVIPARVRSGFAPYFSVEGLPGGKSDDHWINQYWDESEQRWITIDVDGASRIISENIALTFKDKMDVSKMPLIYYASVWVTIIFGIIILSLGAKQPQFLIVIGAVINAFCMFVFAGLLMPVNNRFLPDQVKAPIWRQRLIWAIFVGLGFFSITVILDQLLF